MISPTQIKKPSNWQDFESLCKKLWGEIWSCSDTIQKNGRQGQSQHGVDVYGIPEGKQCYYGIQCKGKDDYSDAQLALDEIDREIEKAASFEPPLGRLVFATTANKDASVETYIRKKNLENIRKGGFEIYLSCWEDIVDLLEQYKGTYKWYVNNCQYKDTTDVFVSFFDNSTCCVISPKYERITKKYQLAEPKSPSLYDLSKAIVAPSRLSPPRRINKTWCKVKMEIMNIGSTVIEDYKLKLWFDSSKIEDIDTPLRYVNDPLIDSATKAQINASRESRQEVFFGDYSNELVIKPRNPVLVQNDILSFSFSLKPKKWDVDEIDMCWEFLSRDYSKSGNLLINVQPIFDDKYEIINVNENEEFKEDEVVIQPLIING